MNTFFFDDVQYPEGLFGGKDFFNPIIYSTEERVVGVGENDKPLYQKTVTSSTLAAATGETVLTGIDSLKVISLITNRTHPFYISTYDISGSGTEYGLVEHASNGDVKLYNAGRSASIVIEAVLQYTKTTDVAGSGSYTTLGIPAVHYDGEERIIGTWFGETLYEKTINCNFRTTTSSTIITSIADFSNIKCFISAMGYQTSVSGEEGTFPIAIWKYNNNVYQRCVEDVIIDKLTIQYTKTTD